MEKILMTYQFFCLENTPFEKSEIAELLWLAGEEVEYCIDACIEKKLYIYRSSVDSPAGARANFLGAATYRMNRIFITGGAVDELMEELYIHIFASKHCEPFQVIDNRVIFERCINKFGEKFTFFFFENITFLLRRAAAIKPAFILDDTVGSLIKYADFHLNLISPTQMVQSDF